MDRLRRRSTPFPLPYTAVVRNIAATLLIVIPSVLFGSLLTATLTSTARANPPVAGEQWVYQVGVFATSDSGDRDRVMSTWGNSGFEAYAVTIQGGATAVYFKKRR